MKKSINVKDQEIFKLVYSFCASLDELSTDEITNSNINDTESCSKGNVIKIILYILQHHFKFILLTVLYLYNIGCIVSAPSGSGPKGPKFIFKCDQSASVIF